MAELGEELRRERVRRNLTFKDVEQVPVSYTHLTLPTT